jgi:hypothetical protein
MYYYPDRKAAFTGIMFLVLACQPELTRRSGYSESESKYLQGRVFASSNFKSFTASGSRT